MKTEDIKKMAQAWKQVQEASKNCKSEKGEKEEKNEQLTGNQHKIDHNKDGKISAADFKGLRKKAKKDQEVEIQTSEATVNEVSKLTPKDVKKALASVKSQPKDKVSLKKAPWDMKKESVQTEAATHKPGVASPAGEGLSPNAKKELARTTPMPAFVNASAISKRTFDTIRTSGKKAATRTSDSKMGDKNIINKPLDITAKAQKKDTDGHKDS